MSWLTRVRNKIPFLPKRETAENLWHKCPECGAMVFLKEYEENLYVCPRCEYHGRIGADVGRERSQRKFPSRRGRDDPAGPCAVRCRRGECFAGDATFADPGAAVDHHTVDVRVGERIADALQFF